MDLSIEELEIMGRLYENNIFHIKTEIGIIATCEEYHDYTYFDKGGKK